MSRLKIEKGASKVRRAPLKVTIDGTVSDDLELMCQWSENDPSYLVNLLLGFAIAQSEEFQRYKAEQLATSPSIRAGEKSVSEVSRKLSPSATVGLPQVENGNHLMSLAAHLRTLSRPLVEYRVILSLGLSAACGVMLDSLYPIEERNPFLQLVAIERPAIFDGLVSSCPRPDAWEAAAPLKD